MATKLLMITPESMAGKPVASRMEAFKSFFVKHDIEVVVKDSPTNLLELLRLAIFIKKEKIDVFMITMPPFRNWSLCFLPRVKKILDFRDGWSVAIETGYGGTAPRRKFKAFMARKIERLFMSLSDLIITCTPGLIEYHQKNVTKDKLLLIPNGYSEKDLELVSKMKSKRTDDDKVRFVCAGKFSEYGVSDVKKLLQKIAREFGGQRCLIRVIGADLSLNEWIDSYLVSENITNINLELLPRMERNEILQEIVEADYGIALIRDPEYDLGTKVFDYLMCDISPYNYFDEDNNFLKYFRERSKDSLSRESALEGSSDTLLKKIGFGKREVK